MLYKSYSSTVISNKDGKPFKEEKAKVIKKVVDDKGDEYEEQDEYNYSDAKAKINKANQKAINKKGVRVEEDEDLNTKAVERRRQLKNIEEKEVPQFEQQWNKKSKECQILQSEDKRAIKN